MRRTSISGRECIRCAESRVKSKNITLTAVAQHFGVWPTVISRIERGLQRDDALVATYRQQHDH